MDSALHLAATSGSSLCIQALLKAGANHEAMDSHGCTPLNYANEVSNNASFVSLLWSVPSHPIRLHIEAEDEDGK